MGSFHLPGFWAGTLDVIDPSVSITSPTTASTYDTTVGNTTVSGTASDNVDLDRVTYQLSGATTSAEIVCTGTTSWTTGSLSLNDGDTTITVRAYDTSENSTSDALTVTTDTVNPSVTITSPTSSTTYNTTGSTVNIGGTASDNVGLSHITYQLSGATTSSEVTCSGTTSWSASSVSLNNGNTTITVRGEYYYYSKGI